MPEKSLPVFLATGN